MKWIRIIDKFPDKPNNCIFRYRYKINGKLDEKVNVGMFLTSRFLEETFPNPATFIPGLEIVLIEWSNIGFNNCIKIITNKNVDLSNMTDEELDNFFWGGMKMDAVQFCKEWERMCKSINNCYKCDYRKFLINELTEYDEDECDVSDCRMLTMENPEISIGYMTKWSEEHPRKTRMQDFLEKCPNAKMSPIENCPISCAMDIGYSDYCMKEQYPKNLINPCQCCWNTPIE